MSTFEPTVKLFTKPIRANILHSQWAEARREMAELCLSIQLANKWLASPHGGASPVVLQSDVELAKLTIRRCAQVWRQQIRFAMEAEGEMEAEGLTFDRGKGKWQ